MKTIKQFFLPLVIRWRARNRCFCCGDRATQKCRTHGTRICGHAFCRLEHRRCRSAVHGSLTNPFCDLAPRWNWKEAVLGTTVALIFGFLFLLVIAL